ncbi:MAG: Aspartate 1-decarboxylase [Candidatus Omnitrophica bacterium]|nr:Aspartate 1-decarboxylase [Candidatus Omnitrophota bacterium]
MLRVMMKSKIHGATVTEANLRYTGSITIDRDLLKAADMMPFERVQIVNLNNGTRVETYILEGAPGSGTICMNGAAARWAEVGDKVIIISYGLLSDAEIRKLTPRVVFVDGRNRIPAQDAPAGRRRKVKARR